jgi:hypothetical protein
LTKEGHSPLDDSDRWRDRDEAEYDHHRNLHRKSKEADSVKTIIRADESRITTSSVGTAGFGGVTPPVAKRLFAPGCKTPQVYPKAAGGQQDIRTIEPSDRNMLEIMQPSTGGLVTSEERRAIVRTLEGSNIWSRVTGGGIQKREYAKNLINDPAALAVVTKVVESYVKQVREKHPALIHVKYSALRTFPNQESQYSRHGNKLHADYTMDCKDLPPS